MEKSTVRNGQGNGVGSGTPLDRRDRRKVVRRVFGTDRQGTKLNLWGGGKKKKRGGDPELGWGAG